jgi:internalin A
LAASFPDISIPDRIAAVTEGKTDILDLEHLSLCELPTIPLLENCREVRMAGNSIAALGAPLEEFLPNIRVLDLARNDLEAIPPAVLKMSGLEELSVRSNRLQSIAGIGRLASLRNLDLSLNALEAVDPSIGELTRLERLNLSGNLLSSLPTSFRRLKRLKELNLSTNFPGFAPGEVLSDLPNIELLDLSHNALEELPAELGFVRDRVILRLDENPLADTFANLLEVGIPDLFRYLRSLQEADRDYEAKLVVVGEGNVGKTSLVQALRGAPFVENRDTTHGIELEVLRVQHPELPDRAITLRSWDFGGQEVYRVTHQFFFSTNALYLLVWRPREGQEENAVEGWVKRIRLRVGEDARIIIVATHGDERAAELDFYSLQVEFGSMLVASVSVDSKTGKGIAQLRDLLAQTAAGLPQMGRPMNVRWRSVREAIAVDSRTHMSMSEYYQLAAAHEVDKEESGVLLELLNRTGMVVHFAEDQALADLIVLQADWLTRAIGFVLEDAEVRRRGGYLEHARLPTIWSVDGTEFYPRALHPYFLRLMERFDVSYRVEGMQKALSHNWCRMSPRPATRSI